MKPTVLLDVDGVLSDFVAGYLTLVMTEAGKLFTHADVTEFDIKRALGLTDNEAAWVGARIQQNGFCSSLSTLPGAVNAVRRLQEIADVYIVTSPWNSSPTWTYEREKWLASHFGIHHSRVLHGSAKHLVRGDVLVDDKAETIIEWSKAHPGKCGVLWQQPWNESAPWAGVLTNDWDRVVRLVETLSDFNDETTGEHLRATALQKMEPSALAISADDSQCDAIDTALAVPTHSIHGRFDLGADDEAEHER